MYKKFLGYGSQVGHYTVANDESVLDIVRHMTSRGHEGKVQCVDASREADYIITGGVDCTTRLWKYDSDYDAYSLKAMVELPMPAEQKASFTDDRGRWTKLCSTVESTDVKQGVTAVGIAGSKSDNFIVGEKVVLDNDRDFVRMELDDIDLEWDERMEDMLGCIFEVREVQEKSSILGVRLAGSSEILRFPRSVVERDVMRPMRDGPIVSATAHGDVFILCLQASMDTGITPFIGWHSAAVNDLTILPVGPERNEFIVVTASDDCEAAVLKMYCEEVQPQFENEGKTAKTCLRLLKVEPEMDSQGEVLRLKHDLPVLQAKHVGAKESDNLVSYVTLTEAGAQLWDMRGTHLMALRVTNEVLMYNPGTRKDERVDVRIAKYGYMCVVNKENGSMLFLTGSKAGPDKWEYVSAWSLEDGMVALPNFQTLDRSERLKRWKAELQKVREGVKKCPQPIATYRQGGIKLDVDHSGFSTSFGAQISDSTSISVWGLGAVRPMKLAVKPSVPAHLLIMPGHERTKVTLRHKSRVSDLRVVEDPLRHKSRVSDLDGEPLVISACVDGTVLVWDVEGADAGQITSQMRSLQPQEILLPPFLLMVSTCQMLSFAFGPTIPWQKAVHNPAIIVYRMVMLDFSYTLEFEADQLFYFKTGCALCMMSFFGISAITGLPQLLDSLLWRLTDTTCFKNEWSQIAPAHVTVLCLRSIRTAVYVFMSLCSTLFVVPLFKVAAQAVDCAHRPNGAWVLERAPQLNCYQEKHWRVVICSWLIVPLFFITSIPYAAVEGDARYVPRSTLYDLDHWRMAAHRKATDINMGPLHRRPDQAFRAQFVELLAKIFLPVVTTLTSSIPIAQMIGTSLLCLWLWGDSFVHPPYLDEKFLMLVQHLRLLTSVSMLCGLLTVILTTTPETLHDSLLYHPQNETYKEEHAAQSPVPAVILGASVILIFAHLVYQSCVIPFGRRDVLVYDMTGKAGLLDDEEAGVQ